MKEQEKLWRIRATHKLLQDHLEKDNMIIMIMTMIKYPSHVIQGTDQILFGSQFGISKINSILVGAGSP
ncbi:hypothetical protein TorRG33x02_110350 [Trema orientale]|uniref:Uncharacterized protein n=1 Tax=Trema orientale TaxID=63057 RepID=A0A2P5F5T3_TREOI|nr:hypothetical protein TorRG33x02_110350 [Trema orientale]